jgi:hypothetical protein
MSSRRSVRQVLVAVLLGVLVGGGLMAVTPAGAEVSSAVATNWKKIWKKNLKPLADKRYYSKKQSNARYQPKGSYETAGSGYTKAETYSKAEIDAKLAPLVNAVAASASGNQQVDLSGAEAVVRSVSLTAPAAGTVVVTSSAYAFTGTSASVRCSLTTGNAIDFGHLQYAIMPTAASTESLAGTRAFPVTKGSVLTVNLVCDLAAGAANLQDSSLAAIFAPS